MDEVTKAFYNAYPVESKADFFPAYVMLKYYSHFLYHAIKIAGQAPKDRTILPEAGIDELLETVVQHIAETSLSSDTNIYHGKVLQVADAVKFVTQKEPLRISPPEQVIPFKVARDIVMENPTSIALGKCVCRLASPKPCLPADKEVCLMVGGPHAAFIGEKNPLFRKCTQEEAIKVIEDAHKRGDVHCAYFNKDVGNRFYALCNCCSCCCLGVKMWNMLGGMVPILAPSGYVATVSKDDCNGCGSCEGKCHFKALTLGDQVASIDKAKCMGCGVCEDVCPTGAIKMVRDASKGEPLDLDELKKLSKK